MNQTLERLKAKQAAEYARVEKEIALCAVLPIEPQSIYQHKDYAHVSYECERLGAALAIFAAYGDAIESAEHWKDGCLSIMPAPLNTYADNERAQMDGESIAELCFHSYGEQAQYSDADLIFWVKLDGERWAQVRVRVKQVPHTWRPRCEVIYEHGRIVDRRLIYVGIGEDQVRKWSADPPNYRVSYYWADRENFLSWINAEIEKGA